MSDTAQPQLRTVYRTPFSNQLNSTQRVSTDAGVKHPLCPHLSSHYCTTKLQSTHFVN